MDARSNWTGVYKKLQKFLRFPRLASRRPAPPRIGLALCGGFARGLAHIGVLKVLEENHIPVHCIAGTSVGSLVGGAYASGVSVREMAEAAASIRFRDFARWTVSRMGFASNARMEKFIRRTFQHHTFEEMRIPLAVVATDISNGEPVVFRHGSLLEAVRASCAYPGLFLPVEIDGKTLVDGAISCSVPTPAASEMGATRIIAVNLPPQSFPSNLPQNAFQVLGLSFSFLQARATSCWMPLADCIIEPQVAQFAWDGFESAPEIIAAGEEAARQALPLIQSWLARSATALPRPQTIA